MGDEMAAANLQALAQGRRRTAPGEAGALRSAARLIVPVLALTVTLLASFLYIAVPLSSLGGVFAGAPSWATAGHLLFALTFLALNLTNRRYGAGLTIVQALLSWALLGVLALAYPQLSGVFILPPLPEMHLIVATVSAAIAAHIFGALMFEWRRGVQWWTAPLHGALWGGLLFCAIAWPSALGVDTPMAWAPLMLAHMSLMLAAAIAMLVPYWALRSTIRPLPFFNGY